MRIILISFGIYEYDGRLRELVKVAKSMGNTYVFCRCITKKSSEKDVYFSFSKTTSYLSFLRKTVFLCKQIKDVDIIWADNRKGILPCIILHMFKRDAMLINDSRELYIMEDVRKISSKIGCIIEMLMNKKFDITICANKERAKIMKEKYNLKNEPIVYENIRRLSANGELNNDFIIKVDHFIKMHQWNFVGTSGCSLARGTESVIKAIGNLGINYGLFLVGESDPEDVKTIKSLIKREGYKNIHLINQVNQNALKYIVDSCSVGIINYHMNDLNNKYCASGKIYEFIFEGLPILCSPNPPLYNFCELYHVGISGVDYQIMIKKITENYSYYHNNALNTANTLSDEKNRMKLKDKILENIKNRTN